MREVLLCKYGEIVLKGLNKGYFESILKKDITRRLRSCGNWDVHHAQSTMYAEPMDDQADLSMALDKLRRVFGIAAISRALAVEKDMDAILSLAPDYLADELLCHQSFKVEARRSDKRFPKNSPQICATMGEVLLNHFPHLHVDVHQPDVVVHVEIRETHAYIHAGSIAGAGGVPCGCAGSALLLLSGGIDSPVAGYMMAKRGAALHALHFESYPYTSVQAKEKVLTLAKQVAAYSGPINGHIISLTKIQETMRATINEEYFTLLLRRFMMRLADRVARSQGCEALITGESLGQVASQTMQALAVTDAVATMPVFRPCIGMDKEEIVQIARKIDTFETSILPYEDCCTVFTPKHPKTRPTLEAVLAEEAKLDIAALEDEAFAAIEHMRIYPS